MSEYRRRLMQMTSSGGGKLPWIEIREGFTFGDDIQTIRRMWNLATGQEFLPDNWHSFALSADSYPAKMGIEWNSNVKTINGNLFSNSRIIGLSPYLFAPIAGTVESFYRAFAFNTGLRTVPSELFDGVKNIRDNGFQETFRDTYITGSTPKSDGMELWEKFPYAGLSCFRLCTMLDNYSQIPDYWK